MGYKLFLTAIVALLAAGSAWSAPRVYLHSVDTSAYESSGQLSLQLSVLDSTSGAPQTGLTSAQFKVRYGTNRKVAAGKLELVRQRARVAWTFLISARSAKSISGQWKALIGIVGTLGAADTCAVSVYDSANKLHLVIKRGACSRVMKGKSLDFKRWSSVTAVTFSPAEILKGLPDEKTDGAPVVVPLLSEADPDLSAASLKTIGLLVSKLKSGNRALFPLVATATPAALKTGLSALAQGTGGFLFSGKSAKTLAQVVRAADARMTIKLVTTAFSTELVTSLAVALTVEGKSVNSNARSAKIPGPKPKTVAKNPQPVKRVVKPEPKVSKPVGDPPDKQDSVGLVPFIIGIVILIGLILLFGTVLVRKRQQISEEIETAKAEAVQELQRDAKAVLPEGEPREGVPDAVKPAREPAVPEQKAATIRDGLAKTQKEGFIARLGDLFKSKDFDETLLDDLEEVLFTADIGVKTAQHLLDTVKDKLSKKEIKDSKTVWEHLKNETLSILKGTVDPPKAPSEPPYVIMVVGVNGTGKTTTIGKLANRFTREGKSVLLAAGDTFRAAAVEQLTIWGERVGVPVHRGKNKADPASVIFDGIKRGVDEKVDIVIADTAGRLHTAANLMQELEKIGRVMKKIKPDAPHEVLLVLDATMGQNSIQQANQFKQAMDVSGIVLTKLDGTAKGGVIIAISKEMGIPIRYVGVGEQVVDLQPFEPQEFVDALFEAID